MHFNIITAAIFTIAAGVIAAPPVAVEDSTARGLVAKREGSQCNERTNEGCDSKYYLGWQISYSKHQANQHEGRFYKAGASDSSVLSEGLRWTRRTAIRLKRSSTSDVAVVVRSDKTFSSFLGLFQY
ncbi:uncharacterized protein RSE6_12298 [Rhynchosporium secalis]|uniref:Uncharacterized protein n=1 Tax=Rhynchosporium secalis TaxID=38038 RepID=A0A1E1MQ29_RHYSE|nr:uncharacterized protein RSE6_12298 [Rhynchosporium secalis]